MYCEGRRRRRRRRYYTRGVLRVICIAATARQFLHHNYGYTILESTTILSGCRVWHTTNETCIFSVLPFLIFLFFFFSYALTHPNMYSRLHLMTIRARDAFHTIWRYRWQEYLKGGPFQSGRDPPSYSFHFNCLQWKFFGLRGTSHRTRDPV